MSSTFPAVSRPAAGLRLPKALALAIIFGVAATFVFKYVVHYFTNYNQAAWEDPLQGAANYWRMRGWLLLHITSGTVAALIGPLQFSTRLRKRNLQLHRNLGRTYLIATVTGSIGATSMAIGTTFGWAFGFSLASMALVWFTCGAMAYYAVRNKQIQLHQEWMVRSYILTFGFVTFRLLNDYGPTSHLKPVSERADVFVWACWVLPLLAAEVIMQARRIRSANGPVLARKAS